MPFRKIGYFHHLLGFRFEDYSSLYDLSLNAYIQSLWEKPEIKIQISDYFKKYDSFNSEYAKMKAWHKITKTVLDSISEIPHVIMKDCQDGVVFVGEEIQRWTRYVIDELGLDLSYAQTIYWTKHSTVDEGKIFKLFWQNNERLWEFHENCPLGKSIYQLACIFVQEAFILENADDMMAQLRILADLAGTPFRVVKHLNKFHEVMNTWIAFYKDGIIDNTVKVKSYQKFYVSNVKNFSYGFYSALNKCRELRFSQVANYIINCSKNKILGENFNALASADLINYCDSFCKDTFGKYLYYEKSCEDFFLKLFDDVLAFEQDTILEDIEIEPKFNILKALLRAWPYRRYCQPYFELVLLPLYKEMFFDYSPFFRYNNALVFINKLKYFLNFMAYKRRDDFLCGCPVKRKAYEEMLKCMWSPVKESDKKLLIVGGIFLEWYYDCLDLSSLKIIDKKCLDKDLAYKKMDKLAPKSACSAQEKQMRGLAVSEIMKPVTEPVNDIISDAIVSSEVGQPEAKLVKNKGSDQRKLRTVCSPEESIRPIANPIAEASNDVQVIKDSKSDEEKEKPKQDSTTLKSRYFKLPLLSAQEKLMRGIELPKIMKPVPEPIKETINDAFALPKVNDPETKPLVKVSKSDRRGPGRASAPVEIARPIANPIAKTSSEAQVIKESESDQEKKKPKQDSIFFEKPLLSAQEKLMRGLELPKITKPVVA